MSSRFLWLAAALLIGAGCDSETPEPTGPGTPPPPTVPADPPVVVSADVPPFYPVPSPEQLAWHEMEMTAFIHYGWITYTLAGREFEPAIPDSLNPTAWNPRQWGRIARETGFGGVIFVAKHHDGFTLWPSETTDFNISRSPFRGGNGDMVREAADAIRAEGLEFGVYVSPWDIHEPTYGTAAYNEVFDGQVAEVMSNYGSAFELWFDGARGHDSPENQAAFGMIDFPRVERTARAIQPGVMVGLFGTPPDFRWGGNENGIGTETTWMRGDASYGPNGFWQGPECNVPLRAEFFWRAADDPTVKTVDQLVDIYFKSQGRSCQLLIGLAPDRTGLIPTADAQRLYDFRARLDDIFRTDLAAHRPTTASSVRNDERMWAGAQATDPRPNTFWAAADGTTEATLEVDLGTPTQFNVIEIREPIRFGQRVARHRVEVFRDGVWAPVVSATTVGYRRLHRIPRTDATRVRLVIEEALAGPVVSQFSLYDTPYVTGGER